MSIHKMLHRLGLANPRWQRRRQPGWRRGGARARLVARRRWPAACDRTDHAPVGSPERRSRRLQRLAGLGMLARCGPARWRATCRSRRGAPSTSCSSSTTRRPWPRHGTTWSSMPGAGLRSSRASRAACRTSTSRWCRRTPPTAAASARAPTARPWAAPTSPTARSTAAAASATTTTPWPTCSPVWPTSAPAAAPPPRRCGPWPRPSTPATPTAPASCARPPTWASSW